MHIGHLDIFLRVLAAFIGGALLGIEREYKGREAGLKSHTSLSVACCLAILVSAFGFADVVTPGFIVLDPSRIAAGVEGGIGFACAAVIWRSRSKVIGLTTAINIWATANIGMACGAGMFFAAALLTGAMLSIHILLGRLERKFLPHHDACTISITIKTGAKNMAEQIARLVADSHSTLLSMNVTQSELEQPATIEVELGKSSLPAYTRLLDTLTALPGVTTVRCSGVSIPE